MKREPFIISRLLDFASRKELIAQTGHEEEDWPLVVLKELVDNALDACEEHGIAPEITVTVGGNQITVTHNGPGIPASTIAGVTDFAVRVSSREAYVAPDRGRQGNALKTVLAMPFVLDGDSGQVDIEAAGVRHAIEMRVDHIRQQPELNHQQTDSEVQTGTRITVRWPDIACSLLDDARGRFVLLVEGFAAFNPHASIVLQWNGQAGTYPRTRETWPKWTPAEPTPAHWYLPEHLERLIAAHITAGTRQNVGDLLMDFRGFKRSSKRKLVLDQTGLVRTPLSALAKGGSINRVAVEALLDSMRDNSNPVKPAALGVIGEDHVRCVLESCGGMAETVQYRRVMGDDDGLPYVLEVGFAAKNEGDRHLIVGVNWSPAIENPFRSILDNLLGDLIAGQHEPVIIYVHLAHPRVEYKDRGKAGIVVSDAVGADLISRLTTVTRAWTKQRRSEQRDERRRLNRHDRLSHRKPDSIKEVAYQVMEQAYMRASSDGKLPTKPRQIYYPARGPILEKTGRDDVNSQYFSQTLLVNYCRENPEQTANWNIVWDARGSLLEPHTDHVVPLGTLEVRKYLGSAAASMTADRWSIPSIATEYPTSGPRHRYGALLFVEKEGFGELFKAARLAERYDIAIMSTKGMSVTAARQLVDVLCHNHKIPVLVMHDFDKSGLSIFRTLTRSTRRYKFDNAIHAVDLGLHLAEAREMGLAPERVTYRADPRNNLRKNGATEEEVEFLCSKADYHGYSGQRIELNAMTGEQLLRWVEQKLQHHGVKKVVPDSVTLAAAYRRAVAIKKVNAAISDIRQAAVEESEKLKIPEGLEADIRTRMLSNPAAAWDDVVSEIIRQAA